MKKNYTEPAIYVENVVVENGIAASLTSTIGDAQEDYYSEDF